MSIRWVSWVLYLVGLALVAGTYVGVISTGIGWIGWVIGMAGWGMTFLPGYRRQLLSEELERLDAMHREGRLSDEEFAAAKEQVLARSSAPRAGT